MLLCFEKICKKKLKKFNIFVKKILKVLDNFNKILKINENLNFVLLSKFTSG